MPKRPGNLKRLREVLWFLIQQTETRRAWNQRGNTAENNAAARKEQPFEIRSQCKCRFCLDKANGRFEMVSVQLPCFKTK
ncbi:hypothetical protein ACFX19_019731 [Malus domestica]